MNCPKCGYENPADWAECLHCGVIFAKLHQGLGPAAPRAGENAGVGQGHGVVRDLLLPLPEGPNGLALVGRAAILLGIVVWGGKLILGGIVGNAAGESLLHLINLPFHEAGHVFFSPFGRFLHSLGGTLGQLLVPLICLATLLLKTRDPFGGALCLWWFGENFLDIAPYVNDARAGQLPLVGGNFGHSSPYGFHDWEYLLTETGLLRYDHLLAKLAYGLGVTVMLTAMAWAATLLYRQIRSR